MIRFLGLGLVILTVLSVVVGKTYIEMTKEYEYTLAFSRGTSLTDEAITSIQKIAQDHSDGYRFSITGHTGTEGDRTANMALSLSRAEKVKDELELLGISDLLIEVSGAAGDEALKKDTDESLRAYERRLARATVKVTRSE